MATDLLDSGRLCPREVMFLHHRLPRPSLDIAVKIERVWLREKSGSVGRGHERAVRPLDL